MTANNLPLAVPLKVDVTTDDKITPHEIEYSFRLMFDERSISVLAYNLETILAEKLETVLSRNIGNTRPRDFYDIHILNALRGAEFDVALLRQALNKTTLKRNSLPTIGNYRQIIEHIKTDPQMKGFWETYGNEYEYAKGITFDETCETIVRIMEMISE